MTQPKLELEYWEHQEQVTSPPPSAPGPPQQQQPFLPPPAPYHHAPPQSGFASPPHDPYHHQPPPMHGALPPSQPLLPPPSAQSQQDPRFTRQRLPLYQAQPQQQQQQLPVSQTPPYPYGLPTNAAPPNQFIPQSSPVAESPAGDPRGWNIAAGARPVSDPPPGGDRLGDKAETKRSTDPPPGGDRLGDKAETKRTVELISRSSHVAAVFLRQPLPAPPTLLLPTHHSNRSKCPVSYKIALNYQSLLHLTSCSEALTTNQLKSKAQYHCLVAQSTTTSLIVHQYQLPL